MYSLGRKNKLYLGNKMVGIRQFNFPWFDASADILRSFPSVGEVFNPADRDRSTGFYPPYDCMGTVEDMKNFGFSRREALAADYAWICADSDGLIIGNRWPDSTGTISEIAVHQALGLPVWEFEVFCKCWDSAHLYEMVLPPIMKLGSYGSIIDR